jgi:rhodanese-related sulfurtransferase
MRIFATSATVVLCAAFASSSAFSTSTHDDKADSAATQAIRTLTPAEVQVRMQRGEIVVFDANPTDIFNKHHVPGAKWVAYDAVSARDLPSDKSTPIVFYCMNEMCSASPMAARRARSLGWNNIYLMPKGIQGWIDVGLPTASDVSGTAESPTNASDSTAPTATRKRAGN